jgi:hypothetical protein
MTGDVLPPAMELDLEALELAEVRFARLRRPAHDDRWEDHAWEVSTRIDLVIAARRELADER